MLKLKLKLMLRLKLTLTRKLRLKLGLKLRPKLELRLTLRLGVMLTLKLRLLLKLRLSCGTSRRNITKDKRFLFWDDYRPVQFGQSTVPVTTFLNLFNG